MGKKNKEEELLPCGHVVLVHSRGDKKRGTDMQKESRQHSSWLELRAEGGGYVQK